MAMPRVLAGSARAESSSWVGWLVRPPSGYSNSLANESFDTPDGYLDHQTGEVVDRYCAFCHKLQVRPHPAVQLFLRLRLPTLRPVERALASQQRDCFKDADLYAFCDFILRDTSHSVFDHWKAINLELCGTTPAGCQMLARVLQIPGCHVHTVNVCQQRIGHEGSVALVEAVRENPWISRLRLRMSFVGDRGADEFCSFIRDEKERVARMSEIDLSNNMLSFKACVELQVIYCQARCVHAHERSASDTGRREELGSQRV